MFLLGSHQSSPAGQLTLYHSDLTIWNNQIFIHSTHTIQCQIRQSQNNLVASKTNTSRCNEDTRNKNIGIQSIYLTFSQKTTQSYQHQHYRRPVVCRVPGGLPSVVFRALGKDAFAECFFFDTRQRSSLPIVFFTLGKENFKAHFEAVN